MTAGRTSTTASYRVYWQPGCSSCLKMKEFLTQHGIDFESINVAEQVQAIEELERLGARSVPVLARGESWVFGQELEEVARFIGVKFERQRLSEASLVGRLERLLRAAASHTRQLPAAKLETRLPGRADRALIDLAWHPAMIVGGFLSAARGGVLEFRWFERRPQGDERNGDAVCAMLESAAASLIGWWQEAGGERNPVQIETYYGRQPRHAVLERTAWHVAQHCRQLEHIVRGLGLEPDPALGPRELAGLPLPERIWDPEIS